MHITNSKIIKVDKTLGLVMGWAIVSKVDGEEYFDSEGDHIPEDSMLEASLDFMKSDRVLGDMHTKKEGGIVVFAWPMTEDIAKSFGIKTETTGLMIAIKPENDEMLAKFESGEYTGFSIGGSRVEDEEIPDE